MSEEIVNDVIESGSEDIQSTEVEAVEETSGDVTPEAPAEPSAQDAIKAAQERAGKAIAAQRKLMNEQNEKLRQENERLKQMQAHGQAQGSDGNYDPSRVVYDATTKMYYNWDSSNTAEQALAAQVWREQKAAEQSRADENKKIYAETADKIIAGHSRFDNFDSAVALVMNQGNDYIGQAFTAAEDPAKLVHYLGNNTQELNRLASLPPHQVQREMVRLELALQDQKKLITKAKTPIDHLGETKNKFRPPESQSYEEREAYWKKQINPESR